MKKGMIKKIIALVVMVACMLPVMACDNLQVDKARFNVRMDYGYGGGVEIGSYAPFYVEITNNGNDFEGSVQMIIPGRGGENVMHEKELSIQKGATKTIELVGMIDRITRQVNIRILNDNGKVIWSNLMTCSTATDLKFVNVGVLSDDYSALGYMDHKAFSANNELSTQLVELDKDRFPSDWRALDMLDVIVISDFSTDLLSEEQLNALTLWVNDGGLLMVGTGSTSNKTLASLNGKFFDVKVGDLENHNTKFGLTLTDFTYDYGYDDYYYNAYSDSLYTTYYEDNYEDIRDDLEMGYMDSFMSDYGYDPYYDTWDEYWEDSFYWYCFDAYYATYLAGLGEGNDNVVKVEGLSYVDADILSLSGEQVGSDDCPMFWGEDSDGEIYKLAYVMTQGEGKVLLSTIDFTKTPFSNYDGNSMLFIHWVETLIGARCYEDAMNYSDGYGYYNPYEILTYEEEEIFRGVKSATVPPVLVYIGILLLYIIAILVLYLVLRHKKKTVNLWVIYPIVAVGLSILIFCIGFSTRIYRPVVNAVTLITPNGSTLEQRSYVGVTVPGNKSYEIGFAGNQAVEYINLDYSYSYNYYSSSEDEIDWDSYGIGYRYSYDSVEVLLGEQEAMGHTNFYLTAVTPDTRNIVMESESGYYTDLVITNDYGCNLENAAIIRDGSVYIIGDMKAGESVKFSDLKKEKDVYLYSDGLGKIVMKDESAKSLLGLAFGSISGTYDEYLCNIRAYNGLTDVVYSYSYSGSAPVTFVAIPEEKVAAPLQGSTNYNERRVEVIYTVYYEPDYWSYQYQGYGW